MYKYILFLYVYIYIYTVRTPTCIYLYIYMNATHIAAVVYIYIYIYIYMYIYRYIDHIVYPLLNTYIAIHKNDTSAKPWHHDTSAKPWHQVFPPCSEPEAGTTIMREPEAGAIPSAAKKGRSNDILRTCECVALPRYLCSGLNPCALYRTLA